MRKEVLKNKVQAKVVPALLVLLATTSLSILPKQHTVHASRIHYSTQRTNNGYKHIKVLRVLSRKSHHNHYAYVTPKRHHSYHHYKRAYQPRRRYNHRKPALRLNSTNLKHLPVLKNRRATKKQARHQQVFNKKQVKRIRHAKSNVDKGLSNSEKRARAEVVYLESRGRWNVSNGTCYGRYQLLPQYLGWSHGHLNMNHEHQTKIANAYVAKRYGSWKNALRFHLAYGYY